MSYLTRRYKVESIIGEGGMGKVYLANDSEVERKVAIKKVSVNQKTSDKDVLIQRIEREYEFLSMIDHRNVVKVYDFVPYHGEPYLVMEFVGGISLKQVLLDQILPLYTQMSIASQILRGVEILNISGILHRDLKPDNIMIDKNSGVVKILDLGLGISFQREMTKITQPGQLIGTTDYMSPEQMQGIISPNSDVFSLGIILYQIFAWMPSSPFSRKSIINIIHDVMHTKLPPLKEQALPLRNEKNQSFYAEISDLLDHCLEKDHKNRIENVSTLIQKLKAVYKKHINLFQNKEKWQFSKNLSAVEISQLKDLANQVSAKAERQDDEKNTSIYNMALVYYLNSDNEDSLKEGIKLLNQSATQGHIPSMYQLGKIYQENRQHGDAIRWFREAAEKQHVASMYQLAMIYLHLGRNVEEAKDWLQKAAQKGLLKAENVLKRLK